MSFPLQTLLDLRRRAEDAAAEALASATTAVAHAEAEQTRLEECAAAARARAVMTRPGDAPGTAGEALAADRYRERLAAEVRMAEEAELTHRKGPLETARQQEAAARAQHTTARKERQAVEQAVEREAAEQRRVEERRADEVASELAAARRRG